MRKAGLIFLACLAWWGLIAGTVAAAPPPVMFNVNELVTPEGYRSPQIYGMNNKGAVVGRVFAQGPAQYYPFLWTPDKGGAPLPLLAGYDSGEAHGINDAGQVAGFCYKSDGSAYQACLWQKEGGVQALPLPSRWGGGKGQAYGINKSGAVVGYGDAPTGTPPYTYSTRIPLLWENGLVQEFGLDQKICENPAWYINDQGLVAGSHYTWSGAQGVKWIQSGEIKVLNNWGWAAGWMQLPGEEQKPGIWVEGVWRPLPPLTSGEARSLNDLGQTVGDSTSVFLWQAGEATPLNEVLTCGYDWTLTAWLGPFINNAMQIAAIARRSDSQTTDRVVLLNPVTARYRFRITNLGINTIPNGLNDQGEVVGTKNEQAFLWSNGQMQWLQPAASHAYAINRAGRLAGDAVISGTRTAVLWDRKGAVTNLGGLGGASMAAGVNDNLEVVGVSYDAAGGGGYPCLWWANQVESLMLENGSALGINIKKQVAGFYFKDLLWKAFFWSGGVVQVLSSDEAQATAINDLGEVVGWMTRPGSYARQAFIWDQVKKERFMSGLVATASGINNSSQAVGGANKSEDFAFIWDEKNGLQNLNELLIPPRPDWKLTNASGINSSMQIIGEGLCQGVRSGFLLTRVGTAVTESLTLLLLD